MPQCYMERNEFAEWPVYRALVTCFGSDKTASYRLLRETLPVNAVEAKSLLKSKDIEVARGDGRDVKSVARRFKKVGARVRIDVLECPSLKATVDEALKLKAYGPWPKAIVVEGNLSVTRMFSYLAADDQRGGALLLLAPMLDERLSRKGAIPICGGVVGFYGRAVVAGLLRSIDLPMFPNMLQAVLITFYSTEGRSVQVKYVL